MKIMQTLIGHGTELIRMAKVVGLPVVGLLMVAILAGVLLASTWRS